MAITPKICIKYEADASKITITDDTGVYDPNNEGGYGTPNEDRGNLAGVLVVYYQPSSSDKNLLTNIEEFVDYNDTYENSYKSSFELSYFKDGWYQYNYVLVPTTITPEDKAIYYDTNASQLRQYDVDLNPVEVYDITALLDANDYSQTQVQELSTAKLNIKKNSLEREYFACKECVECGCDEEYDSAVYLWQGLNSSKAQFNISRYEAQKTIERLTKQYRIK